MSPYKRDPKKQGEPLAANLVKMSRPIDKFSYNFLGGDSSDNVGFTHKQMKDLKSYLGYDEEYVKKQFEGAEVYNPPKVRHNNWDYNPNNVISLHEQGDKINLFREVSEDGMRVMGLLSRYLSPGDDPVKLVEALLISQGVDIEEGGWEGEEDND